MGNLLSPSTEVTDPDVTPIPPSGVGPEAPEPPQPAVPVCAVNCGSPTDGHMSSDVVTLTGLSYMEDDPIDTQIMDDNPQFAAFGRSHRWAPNDFALTVQVPIPGEYDVTLLFCETYSGAFGVGKRVFDVSVEGNVRHDFPAVDIFKAVGKHRIHQIKLNNLAADASITVNLKKGLIENPSISGIIVGAVENPIVPKPRPPLGEPDIVVTQAQYDEMISKLDGFIAWRKANAPSDVRHTPTYMFHAANEKVRGLVITYHGFSQYPYDHRIIGRYLYDQGFNVVHSMLAGHFYTGMNYPQTLLAKKYRGEVLKSDILKRPEMQYMLSQMQNDPTASERFIRRLAELNPDFERLMSAEGYMASIDNDEDPRFAEFFDSNHRDYLVEGTKWLRLCDAHPGPVHVMGLSVGGAVAIAVAGANPERVTRCVTYAPLLEIWEPRPNTKRPAVNYIGPLGIAPLFGNWDQGNPFPLSCFTANGRFGGSITSSDRTKGVFKTGEVQMFMVLTEDEDAADVPTSKQFFADCGGRAAGHHFFVYPMSYGVPHPLLDPTAESRGLRNQYHAPMYQQSLSFLITGHVDTAPMFKRFAEYDLPAPPRADKGRMKYYAEAAQTGRYNRYGV